MFLILIIVFYNKVNAQTLNEQSYFPLKKGLSKRLTWYNSKYREVVRDTIIIKAKIYNEVSQIFPPNKVIKIYLRKSNDTIYFFNKKLNKEVVFFGISPVLGRKVGNGTIKGIDVALETPSGNLTGLLCIEMKYPNGSSDNRYYKKGLGLVATINDKGLVSYFISD